MDEKRINQIVKMINTTQPTDIIKVDDALTKRLHVFAGLKEYGEYSQSKDDDLIPEGAPTGAPADIFISKTVPVEDITITMLITSNDPNLKDMDKDLLNQMLGGDECTFDTRVKLYDNWRNVVDTYVRANSEDSVSESVGVMCLIHPDNGMRFLCEFSMTDFNTISFTDFGGGGNTKAERECAKYMSEMLGEYFKSAHVANLRLWYCIQIALLHPVIKDRFRTERRTSAETRKTRSGRTLPPKIRYVKYHTILNEDFDDAFEETVTKDSNYHRKALVWYVTGHWRNQKTKDGYKRIFIDGHWKGALRDIKKSDIRERELILSSCNK